MKNVAVVGATGIAGQQFVVALMDHPWFKIKALAASERSAGKTYKDALKDEKTKALRWYCEEQIEGEILEIEVEDAAKFEPGKFDIVFTALESDVAKIYEPVYAEVTPVISTASAFRYESDVPIMIPGVNFEHGKLVELQRRNRKWKGFISPIPNCTATGLAITLKPLQDAFGIEKVIMTSMQAVSGAGRSPGVVALDIIDNLIPYIVGEEEKVQTEIQKILGDFADNKIIPADFTLSCTCTRVNVLEGHTEAVFVGTKKKAEIEEVKELFREFNPLRDLRLPSAPSHMIVVNEDPFRPQPRLDRNNENGMATTVGRIRKDYVLNGVKYMLVSHNTRMGAARGAVLVAEYFLKEGLI